MDNKPLLWVLGGGAFAFTAVVAYWIFAITLANQLKSDQISPQKTAEFVHAILEANRNNYTDNVVVKLSRDGIEIGAGLGPLTGKVWRIGLMGESSTEAHVLTLLNALESLFIEGGWLATPGVALQAASRMYSRLPDRR